MQVSYNGYYTALPWRRCEFDPRYLLHNANTSLKVVYAITLKTFFFRRVLLRVLLVYFTGTYNTRYITNILKLHFTKKTQAVVDTVEVNNQNYNDMLHLSNYDIVGFGYPIYAFNTPQYFLKYIKKQKFSKENISQMPYCFIYKNSGEVYNVNNASSYSLVKVLNKKKIYPNNEYHFVMPYNICFRFDDEIIREMLVMNNKLADILVEEVTNKIKNIQKYHLINILTSNILKIQYIGGSVNSYFYHVNDNLCDKCMACVKACPVNNIYVKKGKIRFHHKCIMCMRCSFNCHKDAFNTGILNKWRVNGKYDLKKIEKELPYKRCITKDTKGFFKCYIPYYENIDKRYLELFEREKKHD